MRTYKVDITVDAFEQIRAAFGFINERSPNSAEQWLSKLYDRVNSLRTMPDRCGLIRENEAFEQDVRELLHFSHHIIFTTDQQRCIVLVHAVRHANRDEMHGEEF